MSEREIQSGDRSEKNLHEAVSRGKNGTVALPPTNFKISQNSQKFTKKSRQKKL